jgi:hypothetical protein
MISVPASMAAPLIGAIGGRLSWSVHMAAWWHFGRFVRPARLEPAD